MPVVFITPSCVGQSSNCWLAVVLGVNWPTGESSAADRVCTAKPLNVSVNPVRVTVKVKLIS